MNDEEIKALWSRAASWTPPRVIQPLREAVEAKFAEWSEASEMLWIVIANVSGGDWTEQTPEWQEAAARWRDRYFEVAHSKPSVQEGASK